MAKQKIASKNSLPGTIYLNKNRYWWKVQLPGETAAKARPLRPIGARFATGDYNTAVEVAKSMLQKHLFENGQKVQGEILNIATLVRAYMDYANDYYVDSEGNPTRESGNIRYSVGLRHPSYRTHNN